jgi:MerR family transcriptional regulator/heat shock protein HspR
MANKKARSLPAPGRSRSVEWVVSTYSISRRTVSLLIREGLVELDKSESVPAFRPDMVDRIRLILTLKKELGVNMAGVEIILRLRKQLLWYRARYGESSIDSCIDIDP